MGKEGCPGGYRTPNWACGVRVEKQAAGGRMMSRGGGLRDREDGHEQQALYRKLGDSGCSWLALGAL